MLTPSGTPSSSSPAVHGPATSDPVLVGDLLRAADALDASDVHLKAGRPPIVRVAGELQTLADYGALSPADMESLYNQVTTEEQRERDVQPGGVSIACVLDGGQRYRVSIARQRGVLTMAIRRLSPTIPSLDDLRLPSICKELVMHPHGLILVTGPAGSGRSTTLAAMVDYVNERRPVHIVTCESPVEYTFQDKRALVTQVEIGVDAPSYACAVRSALRQDADVLLVGCADEPETLEAALMAAESGCLVLTAMHTTGAATSIERLVGAFPPDRQPHVRSMVADTLEGILSQMLVPMDSGQGRVAAVEVLLGTPAVRNLIREGKTAQIPGVIETGQRVGMRSLDQALVDLYRRGAVSIEAITARAANPERLQAMVQGRALER